MGGKPGFQALRPLRWEAGGRGKSTASIDQNPREGIKWAVLGLPTEMGLLVMRSRCQLLWTGL